MIKINYKGYTVSQASNNHVMITKDKQMVFHAPCSKPLSKEELKEKADWFIDIFSKIVECVEDE